MASNFLQLNVDELEITIPSQKGTYTESNGRFYATRSYSSRSAAIRAYLPSALNNAELNSLNFSFQVKGAGSAWRYTKDEDILNDLSSENHYADISFIYAPAAETKTFTIREDAIDWVSGGSGRKTFKWSNISIEVNYTASVIPSTLIYSFDKLSLSKGESIGLKVDYTPSSEVIVDDDGIKALLYCIDDNTQEIQWSSEQFLLLKSEQASISSNLPMHSEATFIINTTDNLNGYSWKIDIINGENSLLTNGAEFVTFSYVDQRNVSAPGNLSISSGPYYSNITEPVAQFSLTLDQNVNIKQVEAIFYITVDNVVQEFARETVDGTKVYSTGNVSYPFGIKFSPFSVSEETIITKIDFKVTDDYNEHAVRTWPVNSGTTRTVVPYVYPSFGENFTIQRYTINAVGQIEPSMLGQNLITLGTINLSSNTNERSITINWIDENGVAQTVTPEISSYSNKIVFNLDNNPQDCIRFFENKNFSLTTNFNIICTLHDGISPDVVQTFVLPKSTTYFNIEKTGVSIGGFSTGEVINPIFECYYPMYLYFNNKKYAITIDSNGFIKGINTEGGGTPSTIDVVTVESSTLERIDNSSNKYFYLDLNSSTITNNLTVATYLIHFNGKFKNKTNSQRQFKISTNLFNNEYYNLGELESYNEPVSISWDVGIYNNNNNTIAQLIENLKIYVYGTYSGSFQVMAGDDFFSQIEITFTPQT